jgi:hypothetical protein
MVLSSAVVHGTVLSEIGGVSKMNGKTGTLRKIGSFGGGRVSQELIFFPVFSGGILPDHFKGESLTLFFTFANGRLAGDGGT